MIGKKRILSLVILTLFVFLSLRYKENGCKDCIRMVSRYTHKGYYNTGELRYICHDHDMKTEWRNTATIRKFRFKRLYFDKCGKLKLIVKGTGETGCWRHQIKISEQRRENESSKCEKEEFIYLTNEELEKELKND